MNELHKAYAVLGLDPGSSMDSIMRRYKRLIMVWHPDRAPSPEHKEFAEEELKKINNAKDLLTKHFGVNGGHKATGCDCQPGAGAAAGAGSKSSSSGSGGPGPNYHRSKTADDKYQEEQAAKKRDAERRAREEAEANAKRQQEQYKQQTSQQSMQTAMQQQAALRDEKLRWQISIGLVIAFVALEIFGTMAIGAKTWWKDMTWKWQNQQSSSKPPDTPETSIDTNTSTNTGTSNTYIPPYYQTPGGNQETWQREQAQREQEQKDRDQKQYDQDVYFAKLEIDKYEKVIEHCNSELTKLEMQIADPNVSEYEKNRLRDMRDFRQKNLAEGQDGLKYAREKLAKLTGEVPAQIAPSVVSPITGSGQGAPLIPSGSSPFAPPADPNSILVNPSTNQLPFRRKFGLEGLSSPSTSPSTTTPSFSEMMKNYPGTSTITPATKSLFDKKDGLGSLSAPSSGTSSLSELMKKDKLDRQAAPLPSTGDH
ncbi:MAG TPA: hypothetical protein EYN91_19135 [Candidatus Melainabacteria bacterium]|jgi:curved DNA-binding protein CbpA|nr:hypothetical protein [Candidatus Melainabacteria bacterium]